MISRDSQTSPEFSSFRSDDNNLHIISMGHHKDYLVRVPKDCFFSLHIPASQIPHCTVGNQTPHSLTSGTTRLEVCDPCSDYLLKRQQQQEGSSSGHEHSDPGPSTRPASTPATDTDIEFQTLITEQAEDTPAAKRPRFPSSSQTDTPVKMPVIHVPSPATAPVLPTASGPAKPDRKGKQKKSDDRKDFDVKLRTAIASKTIPVWQVKDEPQSRNDVLKNSFIYFCAAREKARYLKEGHSVPELFSEERLNCPVINGSESQARQRFCNVHREDDRQSVGILDYMRGHPSYKAFKESKKMDDDQFRHFILTLVIGRLFNKNDVLRSLGYVSQKNLKQVYQSYKANKDSWKKQASYILNSTYGKVGMTMGQFIFELVPQAVSLLPPLTELQKTYGTLAIDVLSEQLNQCLQKALPLWYAAQPDQTAIHEFIPPKSSTSETRKVGEYEFKLQGDKVCCRPKESLTNFESTGNTPKTLNYRFNFSQAFADAAALCPELIDLNSGMVPGTGTREALRLFHPGRRGAVDVQTDLEELFQEIKEIWPEELGAFNKVTLEHSLCEWNRWLQVRLGHKKGTKAYHSKQKSPQPQQEIMET